MPAAPAAAPLPQVHTIGELERVLSVGDLEGCMLGINNRDLQTFKVDLANTRTIMESEAGQQVGGLNEIREISYVVMSNAVLEPPLIMWC